MPYRRQRAPADRADKGIVVRLQIDERRLQVWIAATGQTLMFALQPVDLLRLPIELHPRRVVQLGHPVQIIAQHLQRPVDDFLLEPGLLIPRLLGGPRAHHLDFGLCQAAEGVCLERLRLIQRRLQPQVLPLFRHPRRLGLVECCLSPGLLGFELDRLLLQQNSPFLLGIDCILPVLDQVAQQAVQPVGGRGMSCPQHFRPMPGNVRRHRANEDIRPDRERCRRQHRP